MNSKVDFYFKQAEEAFKKALEEDLDDLITGPAIAVFDNTIYGLGDTWSESLKEALFILKDEGWELSDIKNKIKVYRASDKLVENVQLEGSEALFILKGSRAYSPDETVPDFFKCA